MTTSSGRILARSTALTQLVGTLAIAAPYYWVARLGLRLASLHGNVSPIWPATGLAIAVMTVFGKRALPGVFLGAFLANVFTSVSPVTALAIGAGNALEGVVGALLIRFCAHGEIASQRLRGVVGYVGAASLAPMVSATIGVTTLSLSGAVPGSAIGRLWLTWWAGDALGALVFAPPLIIAYIARATFRLPSAVKVLQACALLVVSAGVCTWVFWGSASSPMLFIVFPVLLLATAWFGALGVQLTTVGFVCTSIVAAAYQHGPFVTGNLNDSLLYLELFLAALALTALMLSMFHQLGGLALAAVVLMVGWSLSGWLFASLQQERVRFDAFRLDQLIEDIEQSMQQRLATYVDALHSGASLYAASKSVERSEWRLFVASLDLVKRYPGVNGMGVVFAVRDDELETFLQTVRVDAPDFTVHPVSANDGAPQGVNAPEHLVITFVEPLEPNGPALGLDLSTEDKRRTAAYLARDTGKPQITGRIALVQDGTKQAGFLLFVPMFTAPVQDDSIEERRRLFRGWVYAPFVTSHFLAGVLGTREDEIDLAFFEGDDIDVNHRLYTSSASNRAVIPANFARVTHIEIGGQRFTLGWNPSPGFVASARAAEVSAGSSLALVSALLAGLVMSLQSVGRRANQLASERTRELERVNQSLQEQFAERHRAEEEAQRARRAAEVANAAKSDFLATMSHEIRTPLNAVIGYTTLLIDSPLSDAQKSWAQSIGISGRALLDIISDILDFSQIEAGKLTIERVPFPLARVLEEVLTLMTQRATEKKLTLTVERDEKVPAWFEGDPVRTRQILMNLVANAIKFTDQGKVRIIVEWQPADATKGDLSMSVVDTGIGIESDKQSLLFQKFSQAKSSTKRQYGGTGLGLAICRELVELMGGSIGMKSEIGAGSTFFFKLPLAVAKEPVSRDHAKRSTGPRMVAHPYRVLVADDVVLNQKLAATILTKLGCEVHVAANGREAVTRARDNAYDLILMDCQMPELSGFEATRELRDFEASSRANLPKGAPFHPLRIVALTANAVEGDREACLKAGMDDYISKPFRIADFTRVLDRWCNAEAPRSMQ